MLLTKTALVAATLGAVTLAAPVAAKGPETLHLTTKSTQTKTVDLSPKHTSLGDEQIASGTLFNDQNKRAGTYAAICTLVAVHPNHILQHCIGSGTLDAGQITFAGTARLNTNQNTLAITGGTGIYHTARGTIQLHDTNNQTLITIALTDAQG